MKTDHDRLKPIVESWRLSANQHKFEAGADEDEIEAVEYELGLYFPESFCALYKMSDGMYLCHGNIQFERLDMGMKELSIKNASKKLRSWQWKIPHEVVIFGGDGSDSVFGLWLPEGTARTRDCPVVEIGVGDDGLALVATNLCSFLLGRTAFHLLGWEGSSKALDALNLPSSMRVVNTNEEQSAQLFRWADPEIPDPLARPYERPITVDELRARYGG